MDDAPSGSGPSPRLRLVTGEAPVAPALAAAADWLLLLREDPEDAALNARFDRWLDQDPAHVIAWAQVCDGFDRLGDAAEPIAAAAPPPRARRWHWAVGGLIAASLALTIAPDLSLRLRADHRTATAELSQVVLPDGSTAHLGPDSAIAVDFRATSRSVRLLAGQAWFDVRHDPARPFRVDAGAVNATVLGTAFDVRMLGDATSVAVARGKVRVSDRGAPSPLVRDLGAGHWARIAEDHGVTAGTAPAYALAAWQKGKLVARNTRIADLIEEVRPWYRGRILLADAALGDQRVDGVFDLHDPANALIAIVEPHRGQVVRVTPWVMIVR